MKLKTLDQELSVCKVVSISDIDLNGKFFFIGKTDEEISLVCLTSDVPENTTDRVDGWRTFRIEGVLEVSCPKYLKFWQTTRSEYLLSQPITPTTFW